MDITKADLKAAIANGLLGEEQSTRLWSFWVEREREMPRFKSAHILYYLGGLIAIGAMTLFMTLGWERFEGKGLLLASLGYGSLALIFTEYLIGKRQLALPAGLTATLAVVMVPLAINGIQHALGWWPSNSPATGGILDFHSRPDGRWLIMEFGTLIAGVIALWRYRLPFLVLPVAVTLWALSMDLTPFLFGRAEAMLFSDRGKLISTVFGLAMILIGFGVDLRSRQRLDFAFWLYVFGVVTFWCGLTSMEWNSEVGKLLDCGINLLMIFVGALLARRVFALFGGLGVAIYLGHLSHTVFRDSLFFPVALTAVGLAVMTAGIWWQRHEAVTGAWLRSFLPVSVRELVERRAVC
jgi:hypothetical protein